MNPDEAIPHVEDAERALERIRALIGLAEHAGGDISRAARTDLALESLVLQRSVDRLVGGYTIRRRGGYRRTALRVPVDQEPGRELECDRCGGETTQYGDCLQRCHGLAAMTSR